MAMREAVRPRRGTRKVVVVWRVVWVRSWGGLLVTQCLSRVGR